MWHEARKQEKALKGMMVNFQRRAERRREYYERTVSAAKCTYCVGMSDGTVDVTTCSGRSKHLCIQYSVVCVCVCVAGTNFL